MYGNIYKTQMARRVSWVILFCFLINKEKGSFPCGEDARHQNAPLCEFINKAGTGSRQFLPDSPNTAMFYRLVGYIASSQ